MISGFSKLSKEDKINFIVDTYLGGSNDFKEQITKSHYLDRNLSKVIDEFSENTIADFHVPLGVVPNVLINDKTLCIPMAIEESSVVAAAAKAAKFWFNRGGFKTEVISTTKVGQIHFMLEGDFSQLAGYFDNEKKNLLKDLAPLLENMEKRGGGLKDINLKDCSNLEPGYGQLCAEFETCDAMGANFINTVLESLASHLTKKVEQDLPALKLTVVMSILSNYSPDCRVKAWVECSIDELADADLGMEAKQFAQKFAQAVRIAEVNVSRATTHNKGIMNGIDAVVVATGNDYRAVEACAHVYAGRTGRYQSLTSCRVDKDRFHFEIEIPLALGTVGGLTALHPMSRLSLELLGKPTAPELMEIVAVAGLAQNFAAVKSLVTTGIQKGHMKMHLMNILNHMGANEEERVSTAEAFQDKVVTFSDVREHLRRLRDTK